MKLLPPLGEMSKKLRKRAAILVSITIAWLVTLFGIYCVGNYGIAIFVIVPFFLGFSPVIIFGFKNRLTRKEATNLGLITSVLFLFSLLLFALEGLICILMALPLAILFAYIGSRIGFELIESKKHGNKGPGMLVALVFIIPSFSFVENQIDPELNSVVTSIIIDATPDEVWENVVEFPQLKEPKEFIFKFGIAYPINAKIVGSGVGSIRYCNFTTGSFVEPITIWNKPKLLAFDVKDQPAPMKEMSFWDIDAPHLHDYFVSKKGQFELVYLGNGKTKLIGTTWYYNHIQPNLYWNLWSENIIHAIHDRVLEHIKKNSEN
jgi:hypothetical protein